MNKGDKYKIFGISIVLVILFMNFASAAVGIGISPSKMRQQIVAGEIFTQDILVFNTGSDAMEINLVAEGEIKAFTEIKESALIVEAEPDDKLPIENGKIFTVTFNPPRSGSEKIFTGTLSATGKGTGNSQFGGNVKVSSNIELIVVPAKSIFARLTGTNYLIIGIILLLIILIIFLKKSGISISFNK